jgi:hypothetical protein
MEILQFIERFYDVKIQNMPQKVLLFAQKIVLCSKYSTLAFIIYKKFAHNLHKKHDLSTKMTQKTDK